MSEESFLGKEFELEIAKSWTLVNNAWRLRLRDGGGIECPADELVLLPNVRLLNELKRTNKNYFSLKLLRTNQISGLLTFEKKDSNNYGLVFINFYNEHFNIDRLFVFRLVHLYMFIKTNKYDKLYFPIDLFERSDILSIELDTYYVSLKKYYDLKPLLNVRNLL